MQCNSQIFSTGLEYCSIIWVYDKNSVFFNWSEASLLVNKLAIKRASKKKKGIRMGISQSDSLEKEMATHSSTLSYKIPWMVGYSPWGHEESDMTERLHDEANCRPFT